MQTPSASIADCAPTQRRERMSLLSFATLSWEARPGQRSLTVCAKATFRLVHGGIAEVVAPADCDGAAAFSPLELAPFKPRADVVVLGHAWAPGGRASALTARVSVGDMTKSVSVSGDRAWLRPVGGLRSGALMAGPPGQFERMELSNARAPRSAGNPAGIAPDPLEGAPLPNLGATFAPTDPPWTRAADDDASRWARAVMERGLAAGPPPADLDWAVFQTAPPDQQLAVLPAAAEIALEHLHPRHARYETRLPALRPRVRGPGGRVVALRPDTLVIDADRELAHMTWRCVLELDGDDPDDVVVGLFDGAAMPASPLGDRTGSGVVRRARRGRGATMRLLPGAALPSAAATLLSLEDYAAIQAEIAERGVDPIFAVAAWGVSEATWKVAEQRWSARLAEEAARGGGALLSAYDEAYLAAQRPFRAPLDAASYARVCLAIERGDLAGAMAEQGLSLGDLLRLRRVWEARMAEEPALRAEVEAARAAMLATDG